MPQPSFTDLGVSAPVVRALADGGITRPFPIQALVLPDALSGRDILARSQTGSGKTLAFALPIVERMSPSDRRPRALVLVPTRELAAQVVEEFARIAGVRGLRAAAAYGGVTLREQAASLSRADVVVATPGRMEDLASRGRIRLDDVRVLVLDEADRMLDMGFQPQVEKIVRRLPRQRQTMLLSATLGGQVGRLAAAYTRDPLTHEVDAPRRTVKEVEHRFVPVTPEGKLDALVDILEAEPGRALVFVRTKRNSDRLAKRLRTRGIGVAAMHGDLSQPARERNLARFESGRVTTLVATDVAARGLDVPEIARVINYDPPEDDDGYVHRVGRTARAGRSGAGVTLVLPEQRSDVSRIAARLRLVEEFRHEGMEVAPPRLVYSSRRGRRSLLYGRPRRSA